MTPKKRSYTRGPYRRKQQQDAVLRDFTVYEDFIMKNPQYGLYRVDTRISSRNLNEPTIADMKLIMEKLFRFREDMQECKRTFYKSKVLENITGMLAVCRKKIHRQIPKEMDTVTKSLIQDKIDELQRCLDREDDMEILMENLIEKDFENELESRTESSSN